jgi:glycosyl transferase, family 25
MKIGNGDLASDHHTRTTTTSKFITLVINLDSAPERMAHMSTELARVGLPFIRQQAVVGVNLSKEHPDFSQWSYRYLHGRRWSPREFGCYLSHIKCLQNFLESNAEYALILEDDVLIGDGFITCIEEAMKFSRYWNMLRLSSVNRGRWWTLKKLRQFNLAICLTREKGSGGYLVDRTAATVMVGRLLPMRMAWDIAYDLEWFWGFKTLGVYPFPVNQNTGFESQVQQDLEKIKIKGLTKYLTVLPFRLALEFSRVLYRSFRLLMLRSSICNRTEQR